MSAGFFYVAFRIISSCSQKKNSHLVCNSLPVICTCLDSNYEVVRASACGLQMHITPYIKARRNTFKLRLYFLAFHIFILSFFFFFFANVIAAVNLLQTRSVFRLCKCIQFRSTIIARSETFLSNWGSGIRGLYWSFIDITTLWCDHKLRKKL